MNRDKTKIVVLPIKPVVQKNHFECGVACVGTILKTMGLKYNRESVKKHLGTNMEYGTLPRKIKDFFESKEIRCREKFGAEIKDLENNLKKGRLCLVAYQSWGNKKYFETLESGHYSVVFGYEKDYLWLADPFMKNKKARYEKGVRKIKKEVFGERWVDEDGKKKLYKNWYLAI